MDSIEVAKKIIDNYEKGSDMLICEGIDCSDCIDCSDRSGCSNKKSEV